MELQVEVTAEVEDQLVMTAPWMNPFKLGPNTIVGYFKHHGFAETVFTSRSPGVALDAARDAFDEYMSGEPYWLIDTLLNHVGDPGALDFLELGCGTGRYAFELALRGAGDVLGIDIRDHNITQARYLQRLDQRLNRIQTLRFEHERASADDPDFLAGRSFDVVLMTVFPILRRPIDQMINVATLTRRAALFHLHLRGDEHWKLLRREPDAIVSAFDGWSWEAPARVFPWLLQTVGFNQVIELTHPLVQPLRDSEPTEPSRLVRLLLPGAITIAPARLAAPRRRAQAQSLRRRYADPAYHTFLALK